MQDNKLINKPISLFLMLNSHKFLEILNFDLELMDIYKLSTFTTRFIINNLTHVSLFLFHIAHFHILMSVFLKNGGIYIINKKTNNRQEDVM
jgi:hypothetical protein